MWICANFILLLGFFFTFNLMNVSPVRNELLDWYVFWASYDQKQYQPLFLLMSSSHQIWSSVTHTIGPQEIPINPPEIAMERKADGPITKRLYRKSSMTSERIYNKVGLRFAPLQMFIFLNLQLLKLQLMLGLEQSRLTWSQTRTFFFNSANGKQKYQ